MRVHYDLISIPICFKGLLHLYPDINHLLLLLSNNDYIFSFQIYNQVLKGKFFIHIASEAYPSFFTTTTQCKLN